MRLSGTSMATAVATGVVALAMEAAGGPGRGQGNALTANAVKAMLQVLGVSRSRRERP